MLRTQTAISELGYISFRLSSSQEETPRLLGAGIAMSTHMVHW
jgi:hypothetical protein